MNNYRANRCGARGLLCLALAMWGIMPAEAATLTEETFAVLQTKTGVYTNVTVTTKDKNYIFILHAGGMTSLKVAELTPEIQQELGYKVAGSGKGTNAAAAWAKREIAKIEVPQIKALGQQLEQKWRERPPAIASPQALLGSTVVWAVLGGCLLLYVFYCYCCLLICRKTGNPGGILVWLPVLQAFPLLRAANMSGWWFLAFFVPVLNLVAQILWCFNIAKARGKSAWVGLFLLLPIINLFAFLYLAFSDGVDADDRDDRESKIMTLQTI